MCSLPEWRSLGASQGFDCKIALIAREKQGGLCREGGDAAGAIVRRLCHGQDDAELGLAAGHAGVGFAHFFEGEFFDHGAHPG